MKHHNRPTKSESPFILTGKLICGKCGSLMTGDSGTSGTGKIHYYYTCAEKKKRKSCDKKSVQEDWWT